MAIIIHNKSIIFGLNADLAALAAADSAETTARIAGDATLTANLATEVSTRTTDVATLTTNLTAEVTARTAADAAELAARQAAEAAAAAALAAEAAARLAADTAEEAARIAGDAALTAALATETTERTAADATIDGRLNNIESGMVAGIIPKGSVANVAALDALTESALQHGWAYYARDTNDLYMYSNTAGGSVDYAPAGWTHGFIKFADYSELSGLVQSEAATRTASDAAITALLNTEVSDRTAAVAAVNASLTAEIAAREAAVTAEAAARTAAITAEEAARTAADAAELAARLAAEAALEALLKAYADNAATQGGAVPVLEGLVVASNKITLTHAPKGGVNGIVNFARVSYINELGQEYQAPVTLDGTDATGKTFVVSVDVSNEWDGKTVYVQYTYVAA